MRSRRRRRRNRSRFPIRRCLFAFLVASLVASLALGSNGSQDGSQDNTGTTISNPYQSGCLRSKEELSSKDQLSSKEELKVRVRVCNSDDPPDAVALGICRNETDFNYQEIRISSENWTSVIFEAWILQILLSELLDVPTTIETGFPNLKQLNFYDAETSSSSLDGLAFANGQDWTILERASRLGDCRLANNRQEPNNNQETGNDESNSNNYKYKPCAHFIPEVWDFSVRDEFQEYVDNDIVEMPQGLGALVQEGWYIPRFTAERDSSLLSYLGLVAGDDDDDKDQQKTNRHKLAQRFLRPTTWQEYCTQVSSTNCTIPDEVAQRPPRIDESESENESENENETDRMYKEGLYKGHFRNTTRNDCETFPETCTGHIVDYPCGWYSYITPQTHHLGIALESNGAESNSGGYSYDQMIEIWRAANATKSDVVMIWWQPDVLYQEFLGTDAEFMRVALPPPTQACSKARITREDRCSDDFATRVGDPMGACDMEVVSVQKAIATGLKNVSIDDGTQSPGYEALSLFKFTELQINELFAYWLETGDPREAVCQWVVDNRDFLDDAIPRTYPRKLRDAQEMAALDITAIIMASVSMLIVAWITSFVYRKRNSPVMVFAQIEFLYLLLFGLLAIALGAILEAVPVTEATCVASIWLIHLGYTLELVPLIVKVAAINRLMNAAKKMRRVSIKKRFLGGVVCSILGLATVVLALWTGLDTRKPRTEYRMMMTTTEDDDDQGDGEDVITTTTTLVVAKTFCGSESVVYNYIFVAWTTVLLLCATILAFQMRRIREDFNESQTLAIMIYSHFFFVVLRLIVLFLRDSLDKSNLQTWESLIYSFDVLVTVLIYFVPKVVAVRQGRTFASFSYNSRIKGGSLMSLMVAGMDENENVQKSRIISRRHSLTSVSHRTASSSSRKKSITSINNNGTVVGCKHCRGRIIRASIVGNEASPMPEPNESPEEGDDDDEDQPKWCTSEFFEVQTLLPPTTESGSEQDKGMDKGSNAGEDAAVVESSLVDLPQGNSSVEGIKNTEDSSSVHSSEHMND